MNAAPGTNFSVPCSNEPRSKRAVFVVCNNQPCIAATKDASYCRVMTVLCIHRIEDCCNVCSHFKLPIGQHQHRGVTGVTSRHRWPRQQCLTAGMINSCKPTLHLANRVTPVDKALHEQSLHMIKVCLLSVGHSIPLQLSFDETLEDTTPMKRVVGYVHVLVVWLLIRSDLQRHNRASTCRTLGDCEVHIVNA